MVQWWGLESQEATESIGIPSFPSWFSRQDAVGNPERLEMALGKELQRARGQTVHRVDKKQRRDAESMVFTQAKF